MESMGTQIVMIFADEV